MRRNGTEGIFKRHARSFSIVIDLGRDPTTNRRRQKWVAFKPEPGVSTREAMKQAKAKRAELLKQFGDGTYIEASKATLASYLRDWVEKAVKPPLRRPKTYDIYKAMIDHHIAPATIGALPLQHVKALDLERFYADLDLGPGSVRMVHAIIHRALKKAVRDRLLVASPADGVEDRPRVSKAARVAAARLHCWTVAEAREVLDAATKETTQMSAFIALAIDTGARASELVGLLWTDIDLDAGRVTFERQLDADGEVPVFGQPKTDRARTVTLNSETVVRLGQHRLAQNELRLANGQAYANHNLVFAREAEHCTTAKAKLGQPMRLAIGPYEKFIRRAGLRRIKFHGLRHTSATLLLQAGVPIQVVSQRLGHASVTMTLETYAHVLTGMQEDAAARLGAILHGGAISANGIANGTANARG